ncbi:MAG: 3-dehydroquinate synthase [Armatimonadetes bacterium]|nr:3-dehydroquinate synthase [Armatimonadota bacterium]
MPKLSLLRPSGSLAPPARAIFLVGFMAAGKTTVGRLLASETGLPLVDTDELIEAQVGRPISEIFATDGEQAFRDLESDVLAQVAAGPPALVATGGGIMERPANVDVMRRSGSIVWLRVSAEEVLARTEGDATRPLLSVPDRMARARELLARRDPLYAQADIVVDTSGRPPRQIAREVRKALLSDPRVVALLVQHPMAVPVKVRGAAYQVLIGHGLLHRIGEMVARFRPRPKTGAVVTTEGACVTYAEAAVQALRQADCRAELMVVPDGEESKSLAELGRLYAGFARAGLDRSSWVFAVGGGVVGDLAGTAAATYLRGLALCQVPTSLLAQVDSSVGGKVAINLPEGKNLVGAFHQPRLVVADLDTLTTLPEEHMLEGLAEGIKHAALFDRAFFEWLEGNAEAVLRRDPVALRYFVARNVQLKSAIVSQDPTERGRRALLNYGHTIGHALERGAEEWALSHGRAVAVGMVAEAWAAVSAGMAEGDVARRLGALLRRVGLLAALPPVNYDTAAAALGLDKKIAGGVLRLPVVRRIGEAQVVEVGLDFLADALRGITARGGGSQPFSCEEG